MEIAFITIYLCILIYTIFRVLLDTYSTPKTLAYLMLIMLVPLLGILLYYSFGINYRHKRATSIGVNSQIDFDLSYKNKDVDNTEKLIEKSVDEILHFQPLVHFLKGLFQENLSENNFKLLINGEEKFPEVLKTIATAQHFIHMEYYDWENDIIGNKIKDLLLKKVASGLKVRVLYDDYASKGIKKNIVKELKNGGVEIYPKIKVKLAKFANRINHRDHRKIIIVDGKIGFVGGINISDRYDNSIDTRLYWRDTHVKFTGLLVHNLQRHFIVSWNTAQSEKLAYSKALFPTIELIENEDIRALGQVVAGGPIYPMSNIMLSYFRIFSLAKEKLYITNPYFIPNESIMDALKQAAISGVDVRLMVPEKSDSAIVGAASKFYFNDLLNAGVKIYLYKKGFIHAKTVVADSLISVVGTANMDIRSFDLNFEIMSVIYGKLFAANLEQSYISDLENCREIKKEDWGNINVFNRLKYAVSRLISSFL